MKLSQLSLADYNQLDSIPVINQDLSASGFTPVANTYYRHIGATTDTFTQGVIYLYDTAYHKLGESGGTTLNKYTVSGPSLILVEKILKQVKGRVTGTLEFSFANVGYLYVSPEEVSVDTIAILQKGFLTSLGNGGFIFYPFDGGGNYGLYWDASTSTMKSVSPSYVANDSKIIYYNDVEITA